MKETKKIIKHALKHPELFSPAELDYFRLMKKARKDFKKHEVHQDKKTK